MAKKCIPRRDMTSPKIFFVAFLAFLMGFGVHEVIKASANTTPNALPGIKQEQTQLCFTPAKQCQVMILNHLNRAKKSVLVQAYSFTDKEIVATLKTLKQRGVDVRVILDKSNKSDAQRHLKSLQAIAVPLRIDSPPGIAHNKIIIIDEETIITGSYNFSVAAYKRNAENVLIIKNQELAQAYKNNWQNRWAKSNDF